MFFIDQGLCQQNVICECAGIDEFVIKSVESL